MGSQFGSVTGSRLLIRGAIWVYLSCILMLWLVLYAGGDRWWPATLILFGPRWLFSLPLLILVPLAAWFERRHLTALVVAAAILFIPIMGLCLPFSKPQVKDSGIRVLTCNTGGRRLDINKLRRLIRESRADIVTFQEWGGAPARSVLPGWNILQQTNIVIASHYRLIEEKSLDTRIPLHKWPRTSMFQCRIQLPEHELSFTAVHLPSPHQGLSGMINRKTILSFSQIPQLDKETELRRKASQEISKILQSQNLPAIIAGDFNMTMDSTLYREYWSDYSNAFSTAGFGYGFTMKVAIRGFEHGVRIDHIITRGKLAAGQCWVGDDVGSDHLPVIADIHRTEQ